MPCRTSRHLNCAPFGEVHRIATPVMNSAMEGDMTMATKHKLIGSLAVLLLLLFPIGVVRSQSVKTSKSDANAIRVLDEWMAAWNAGDQQRLATTCNLPHVRIAAGKVTVWQTPSEFEKEHLNSVPLERNWHHSAWGRRKVIQSSNDKVHVALSVHAVRR